MSTNSKRSSALRLSRFVAISSALIASGETGCADDLFDVQPALVRSTIWNGLIGGPQIQAGKETKGLTAGQAMLWKYTARCALREDQELEAPDAVTGKSLKFRGLMGIAPEWHDGTCDSACQEKVSSCLIALTNRTGKHVEVSLLSAAVSMGLGLLPDEHDVGYPHQEGAFFGSVFSGDAYVCRGRDVTKAAQVKRFCALEPTSCSGLATFADAGRCDDVCKMSCFRLSDGSERCAAVSCQDPKGRPWRYPITTYLRNKIEAVNADATTGLAVTEQFLDGLGAGASATYKAIDFGSAGTKPPGAVTTFAVSLAAPRTAGRIEVWLDGKQRLGTLTIATTAGLQREQSTGISAAGVSGLHDVVLKFAGGKKFGRLATIEFR